MVFNTTFNNISVISWRSILLVEETGGPKCIHLHLNIIMYPVYIYIHRFMVHYTLFKLDQSSKFPYLVAYKKKTKKDALLPRVCIFCIICGCKWTRIKCLCSKLELKERTFLYLLFKTAIDQNGDKSSIKSENSELYLYQKYGILDIFWQCGILDMFRPCGILCFLLDDTWVIIAVLIQI
jgi:hypothetical protein